MKDNINITDEEEKQEIKQSKQGLVRIIAIGVLVIAVSTFSFLMYSWNFAYSKGTYSDGHGTYVGEFKGKIMHGTGTFTFKTGIIYKGDWKDGVMDGKGELIFPNGAKYEGEFVNGHYN